MLSVDAWLAGIAIGIAHLRWPLYIEHAATAQLLVHALCDLATYLAG